MRLLLRESLVRNRSLLFSGEIKADNNKLGPKYGGNRWLASRLHQFSPLVDHIFGHDIIFFISNIEINLNYIFLELYFCLKKEKKKINILKKLISKRVG